jgi:hypothetical protein
MAVGTLESMVTLEAETVFTGPLMPLRTTLSARSPITTVPSELQVTVKVTELPLAADTAVVVQLEVPLT